MSTADWELEEGERMWVREQQRERKTEEGEGVGETKTCMWEGVTENTGF